MTTNEFSINKNVSGGLQIAATRDAASIQRDGVTARCRRRISVVAESGFGVVYTLTKPNLHHSETPSLCNGTPKNTQSILTRSSRYLGDYIRQWSRTVALEMVDICDFSRCLAGFLKILLVLHSSTMMLRVLSQNSITLHLNSPTQDRTMMSPRPTCPLWLPTPTPKICPKAWSDLHLPI